MKELPIGISDFKTLRENNYFYIDKSLFIENIAKSVGKTLLFTRPRRFGKTMSMSMLRYFFDIKNADDNKKLFHGLNIEKTAAWNEQGKYPVIFISFKDLKIESWEECFETIGYLITNLYNNHKEIIEKLDEV
ncbi:MAG: AAA family ATPase, partial [Fusobacteriaceae bacterium]|nr:AAA family ATPase [Fusobacteriaceae bacterium]